MSVAIEVRSEVRLRSTACRRCSGRSSGSAAPTSTGAATSTSTPSCHDVDSTIAATVRYDTSCAIERARISVSAPNSSESLEATLSTSPVGERRGSTWPICAILRVTICVVPYSAISQVRTTRVWKTTPKTPPTSATASSTPAHSASADPEPPMMPSSTARPTRYGPSVIGRNHSRQVSDDHATTARWLRSTHRRNASGDRVSGSGPGPDPSAR